MTLRQYAPLDHLLEEIREEIARQNASPPDDLVCSPLSEDREVLVNIAALCLRSTLALDILREGKP